MNCNCNDLPVFCQLGVFSKEEFDEHKRESDILLNELPVERIELDEGFSFVFSGDETLFLRLAKWASMEHKCCAWARFELQMDPFDGTLSQKGGQIVLSITGGGENGKQVLLDGLKKMKELDR